MAIHTHTQGWGWPQHRNDIAEGCVFSTVGTWIPLDLVLRQFGDGRRLVVGDEGEHQGAGFWRAGTLRFDGFDVSGGSVARFANGHKRLSPCRVCRRVGPSGGVVSTPSHVT